MYRFTISYFPNASPFVSFNNDAKVDRVVATDEQPTPNFYIIVKNTITLGKRDEAGLIFVSLQNGCNYLA